MQSGIVIVNFNTCGALRDCIRAAAGDGSGHIVVVDNCSGDGSAEMVRCEFPQVGLIANQDNNGFGSAANQGVAYLAPLPYVVVANADVQVDRGTLGALSEYLSNHPRCAVAGPKLVNPDGSLQRSCFAFPGSVRWFLDNDIVAAVLRHVPGLRRWGYRSWRHDSPRRVDWVKGAAIAIRRTAFEEVGGFDESFFMYYEEADLCRRLKDRGWETHFTPTPKVAHIGGLSTRQRPVEMLVELHRSLTRYYDRHHSGPRLELLTLLWKVVFWLRSVRDRFLSRLGDPPRRQTALLNLEAWAKLLANGRKPAGYT